MGGCLLDVFHDYLEDRKQFLPVDNTSSKVPINNQWSSARVFARTFIVLYFHQRLRTVLRFSEPYLLADDLKILAIGHSQSVVQIDIDANDSWIRKNHLELATDKCSALNFCVPEKEFQVAEKPVKTDSDVKYL